MTISGLIGVCLYRLITTIGTLHILLCGHSVYKNLIPIQDGSKAVLIYFTLLNILIPIIEIGQTFIISHRFFMLGSLLILLWAPFSLDRIFQNFRENKTVFSANFLLYALLLLTLITMLTVAFIPIKTSRAYIISAGTWLKSNMPSQARLYSNTRQIPYYAQRNFIEWEVSDNRPKPRWKSNDVIALRLSRKHYQRVSKDLENLDIQVIKVFSNKRGDKAIVFKVP
jgi:hypothetical protein